MYRRNVLRAGAVAGALAVAGCASDPGAVTFEEGFEGSLDEWERDAAIGPEVPVEEFDWEIGVSGEEASAGKQSLRIWTEGNHDDGTAWAVHPVSVESGRAYEATVTAYLWSESESFNTLRDVVMQLGPDRPETEGDFPRPQADSTDQGVSPFGGLCKALWLTDGWPGYSFEWTSPDLGTDTLSLAVGTSVIWKSDATHYVDEISVELEPR
jgi:hypothetical protein